MVSRLASTWAAVRYRRSQSIALVLVSALVTTCAVFAPMFVRTLEQGLLRARLVERDVADTTVLLRAVRTTADPSTTPGDIATAMPSGALRWFGDRVGMTTADTSVSRARACSPHRCVVARDDICDHLELTSGKCPSCRGRCSSRPPMPRRGAGRRARSSTSPTRRSSPESRRSEVPLTVVGVYRTKPDPSYWLRTQIDGKSGFPLAEGCRSSRPSTTSSPTRAPSTAAGGRRSSRWSTRSTARASRSPRSPDQHRVVGPQRRQGGHRGLDSAARPRRVDRLRPRHRAHAWCPCCWRSWPCSPSRCWPSWRTPPSSSVAPRWLSRALRGRSREGGSRVVMAELTFTVLLGVPVGAGVALSSGSAPAAP